MDRRNFLATAFTLRETGLAALTAQKLLEAIALFEMAYASGFMAGSHLPISVRLLANEQMPLRLAAKEHMIVTLTRAGIEVLASAEFIGSPVGELRRFPQIGELFSRVAELLPDEQPHSCILDMGDGDDLGNYPRIAFSSAKPETVLIPDPYFHANANYDALRHKVGVLGLPWEQRQPVLFWRGSAGGHRHFTPEPDNTPRFDWLDRAQLCHKAKQSRHAGMIDIALSSLHQIAEPTLRAQITEAGLTATPVPADSFMNYRYLLDIDGWSNSWSLLHKLIMGSTVVKVESRRGFRQWYYGELLPWKNYIPIKADLSDFDEVLDWIATHPEDCQDIAAAGAALAGTIHLAPAMEQAAQGVLRLLLCGS